jgi:hypothetical protein
MSVIKLTYLEKGELIVKEIEIQNDENIAKKFDEILRNWSYIIYELFFNEDDTELILKFNETVSKHRNEKDNRYIKLEDDTELILKILETILNHQNEKDNGDRKFTIKIEDVKTESSKLEGGFTGL